MGLILLFVSLIIAPTTRWAFVGDSLTLARPGYAALVSQDADRFVCYHLADCIVDWPSDHYDVLVVELGIHAVDGCDHLPGHDLEVFKSRYRRILELASASADQVIVVNVPALWVGEQEVMRAKMYNNAIGNLSSEYGALVADAYGATADCGPLCIGEDGFHPSAAGYERIARAIQEVR